MKRVTAYLSFRILILLIAPFLAPSSHAQEKSAAYEFVKAAVNDRMEDMQAMLQKGVSVNSQTVQGYTALMMAVSVNKIEMAKFLLKAGADVNLQANQHKETALLLAAANGREEMVKLLLENKADFRVSDTGLTPLMMAVAGGHDKVAKLLLDKGENVNAKQTDGWTVLMHAVVKGDSNTVALLLAHHADVTPRNQDDGQTALEIARQYYHPVSVELLKKSGATDAPGQPIQLRDNPKREEFLQARISGLGRLIDSSAGSAPAETPPANLFDLVKYTSKVGDLSAYLSKVPPDGKLHPAIIWITGGDCNSIGDVWSPAPKENDQSARAFREAGIITLYPSLRGGNHGPGRHEGFFGEVDDIIAAAQFLQKQKGVATNQIYLGGHSTGGTMVLLTAELSDAFRAVFSFGPVDDVRGYGEDFIPLKNPTGKALSVRSPGYWLNAIETPTFVFEGKKPRSNIDALMTMSKSRGLRNARFYPVSGVDHFAILQPMTKLIARKILADGTGPVSGINFTEDEIRAEIGGL